MAGRLVGACAVATVAARLVAGYTQVAIDDSVPLAVSITVDDDGGGANVTWTTGFPPDRPSVAFWPTSAGSWALPPSAPSVPATAVLDPEGNPKYHYAARLQGLAPGKDHFAVPSDFHADQGFLTRRAMGHRLCFRATPGSVWGARWLVPGQDQAGPAFFDTYRSPRQVHLSWGGEAASTVVVMWATSIPPLSAGVRFTPVGAGADGRERMAVATVTNYTVDGGTRWYARAELAGDGAQPSSPLPRSTMFRYEVFGVFEGNPPGNHSFQSPPYAFRTPPAAAEWSPSVAFFGDMGTYDGLSAPELTRAAVSEGIDAAVHVGDIAYNMDTYGGSLGDRFLNGVEPISAQIPYLASIGNHDPPADFAARFTFPGGGAETGNRRWSIDLGPVHLVAIDTELVWGGLSEDVLDQYRWLDADLAKADANRAAVPWIVVHGHRPMYCSYSRYADCDSYGGNSSSRRGVFVNGSWHANLEVLFAKHSVDLGLFGHVHSYERFEPVFDWRRQPGAMTHVITGAAGTAEGDDPFNGPPLNITVARTQQRGFGVLKASRAELRWEQRWCGWENCTADTVDAFSLTKQ